MSRRDWRDNGSEERQRKNNFNGKENSREKKGKYGRRVLNDHENVFVYVRVCMRACARARALRPTSRTLFERRDLTRNR